MGQVRFRLVLCLLVLLFTSACSTRGGRARPATPPVSPAPSQEMTDPVIALPYIIRRGDTLSAISRRSGLSVAEIIAFNHLNSTLIRPGQILRLPGVDVLRDDPLDTPVTTPIAAGQYRMVQRVAWTSVAPSSNHRPMNGIRRITVHHTGEYDGMAGRSDVQVLQAMDRFHRQQRGWAAIGYHFIIGRDGTVYEGRPLTMQGAHVGGHNEHNLGITLVGDFHRSQPSPAQLASLQRLLDVMRRRFSVGREQIFGHRDLAPSICPGDRLYEWLQNYLSRL